MKRGLVLGSLIGVAVLSMVVSGEAPPVGPTHATRASTKIEKGKDNLYVITGSGAENQAAFSGGNTAVFITDSGVTLVDTKLPGWGQVVDQAAADYKLDPKYKGSAVSINPQFAGVKTNLQIAYDEL